MQLQLDDNGNWTTYHTMIVTSEDAYELYVTYHSNAGGYDEVDKPLSSIDLGTNKRFLLIGIKFPAVTYLPLILKNGYNIEGLDESQNPDPEPELKEQQPIEPYPAP